MTGPGPSPANEEAPLEITPEMLAGAEPFSGPSVPPLDAREDFEAGITYLAPITFALMFLNIGMFIWQVSVGALENEHTIIAFGALSRTEVLAGDWWRLLSASVLHGSFGHLMGNLMALYVIGLGLEHGIGGPRTALVYLLTAIGASLASILSHDGPSVGASGAVFGFMGALICFLYRNRDRYDLRDKRVAGVMAAWAAYTVLTGLATPYIDNAAHVGGLVAGLAIGLTLTPLRPPVVRRYTRPGMRIR